MSHAGAPNYANLVKMANQIAQFFESQSAAQAPQGIAEHLKKFWDPRMRSQIVQYARSGGTGLRDAAAEAVRLLDSAPR
jgi:formate dehydrogenase subunit delta